MINRIKAIPRATLRKELIKLSEWYRKFKPEHDHIFMSAGGMKTIESEKERLENNKDSFIFFSGDQPTFNGFKLIPEKEGSRATAKGI